MANTEALRLARLATGKDRAVVFGGRYHGHINETLIASSDDEPEGDYLGLPSSAGSETSVVDFNNLAAFERELSRGNVAAAIVEPVLTNCTVVEPDDGFLPGLRELCDRYGALLIVDETHTQFAVWGGGTRRFGLAPDIVTGGKGIAGGIPIGVYGMTSRLAALMEKHPDSDYSDGAGLATGGTLFANALSMAAARFTLHSLLTEEAYIRIERMGDELADGIDDAVSEFGLPWRAHRFGARSGYCLRRELPRTIAEAELSMVPLLASARKLHLANRGVWDAIATSGPSVSVAHEDRDIERYLDALREFLSDVTGVR